jgi:hypothetical protein
MLLQPLVTPLCSSLVFAFDGRIVRLFSEALHGQLIAGGRERKGLCRHGAVLSRLPKSLNEVGGGMLEPALQCGIDPTSLGERSCR